MNVSKVNSIFSKFASSLSDDDLSFVHQRLQQVLCGDRGEVAEFIERHDEVDKVFCSASCNDEWFDMCDMLGIMIDKEFSKRMTTLACTEE